MKSIVNGVKSILQNCGPEHSYSAVLSTYLLYEDPVFRKLEKRLRDLSQWDQELEDLKSELKDVALPPDEKDSI